MIYSLIFCSAVSLAQAEVPFFSVFPTEKPMIAALMIERDLSTPEKVDKAIQWGKKQIKIAEEGGMDGILFEFRGGKILEPAITDTHFQNMLKISKALVSHSKKSIVGVEILWHYPFETLKLAKESGARFVRIDFFVDEVLAEGKKVPLFPEKILQVKRDLKAQDILLLTDIQVKYSTMVDPKITLEQSALRAKKHGSQGIIVTNSKSGEAPPAERSRVAKKGAGDLPVIVGSGFSKENAATLLPYADAAIVGTSISEKTGGPLIASKVRELMIEVKKSRKIYPAHWWGEVRDPQKPSWEILPQAVRFPDVILSKRNELGLLSNFAPTPFDYKGKSYGSVEGFWQATKFPENSKDARWALASWPFSREQVEKMDGFAAKKAGDYASEVMKKNGIDWVSFQGEKMKYKQEGQSPFYLLIQDVSLAKLKQNQKVKETLIATGSLRLLPDHESKDSHLLAWRYYDTFMGFRDRLNRGETL